MARKRPTISMPGGSARVPRQPDTVLAQIHCLRDEAGIGIIDFVFQGPSVPHGMLMWSLELFGTRVLPWLHEP